MSQSFSLRGNHRDTFRLVPVGSTNPGDYIHAPTNPAGFAGFVASPANYYVFCRPAYTGEFTLLSSSVDGGYQYLRTLNPEIDAEGIISLSTLVNNLSVLLETEFDNLPYITADETLSIRVLSTAGGVPTSELQQAPDVTIYKLPGGQGTPTVAGTATYEPSLYSTDNPHIYHYTFVFTESGFDEDLYYIRAYAPHEEIISPDYPDTISFTLDYVPPILVNQAAITSSSSADAGFTPTTTVVATLPETSVTDAKSGPGEFHLQPFMGSLLQTNDPSPAPGGLKYIGWNASGYHQFDEDHLDDWAMTVSSGYMLILTDDNGKDFLYNNHGAAYPSVNQYTLHEIGNAATTKEIHIPDKDVNGGPVDGGTDSAAFTQNSYYQYKLFPYPIKAYCKGDPAIITETACSGGGHTWLTDEGAVADWPVNFSYGGNLAQSLSLTQNVDPGFIDDLEGIEYGFLISATDNAKNTNITWAEFLKPAIVYDTIVELAPNLSWQWIKNYKKPDVGAFVNENGWFNTGGEFLTDGWCDDDSGDNQQDCCTNNGGTWNNNACTSASTTWYADRLTLLVTCTNEQTNQDNLFGVQASHDGINWTEFSGSGNAYLINGQTSQFWISTTPGGDLVKQGSHTLYLRSVNTDGGATGNTYAIEYKWDQLKPTWTTAGTLGSTGGFNRANITWTASPLDDGSIGTTNEVGATGSVLSTGEGYSEIQSIKLFRSKKVSTTPDDWDVVSANPSTYELIELGTLPGSTKEYTDTSFYNVQYDAETIDPYYYWGVPIDTAGNEGQDKRYNSSATDALLLTTTSGVEVTPLVAADVAGALGTTIYIDSADATSVITKTDISVPTTGLVFRTDNMNVVRAIKELSYSADGYTYTSIPIVQRLGENYPVIYADMSYNSSSLNSGTNLIIQDSLDTLGLSHLDGVTGEGGHLGLSYIRIASCEVTGSNITSPTESSCAAQGGVWSESFKPVIIDSVSDLNGVTTIALDSLETAYGIDLNTKMGQPEWKIDIGLIVNDNTVYAFDFPTPIQNQFYYKMTFDNNVPTGGYCLGFPAYTDQTTCETNSKTWIDSWVNLAKVDWTTQLAADLIVGGTLRLETGLSIWSGGYENGEPQGTGLTMDELGLRMFKNSDTTVELDAADGSFAFGNLTDPSGNKLQFDPVSGQLTLIGNLFQIQPQTGNYTPQFAGNWTAGICDGNGSTDAGTACSSIDTEDNCGTGGNCDEKLYTSSDVVFYNSSYWLCILNQSASLEPSETADQDWSLYASGSIEGKGAQSLFLNAASQFFIANQDGQIQEPDTIKILANTQGIPSNITWSIEAWDITGASINCSGSNGVNLYTNEIDGIESSLSLAPNTPVYLYSSNVESAGAERVEITASYNEVTDGSISLAALQDTVSVYRLREGNDAFSIILSNESHSVVADEYGNVDPNEWIGSFTAVQLYRGTELRNCTVSSFVSGANWTSVDSQNTLPNFPTVSLQNTTNADGDPTTGSAIITVVDTDSGDTVGSATFTVSKLLAGDSSKSVSILSQPQNWVYDPNDQSIISPGNKIISLTIGIAGAINVDTIQWTVVANGQSYVIGPFTAGQSYVDFANNIEVAANNASTNSYSLVLHLEGSYELYKSEDIIVNLVVTDNTSDPGGSLGYADSVTIPKLNLGASALTGVLSNESHTVDAAYTGDVSDLSNSGGVFSVYQGANLIPATFKAVGSWYGRMWKEETADAIIPDLDTLSFETLLGLGTPDQFKIRKWSELNSESRIDMSHDHDGDGNTPNISTFFDTDPGDHFVVWATTYFKVGADISPINIQMGGDNEYKVFIDGSLWASGNNTTFNHVFNMDVGTGLATPGDWGQNPTDNALSPDLGSGDWHRIDLMYHENTGGDYVKLGFNLADFENVQGGSSVVCDIDPTTGAYNVLYLDPTAYISGGIQYFDAEVNLDDGNGGNQTAFVNKEYSITKSFEGNPGTYYKSLYLTVAVGTFDALESLINNDNSIQWPLDNAELEGLDGWIDAPPADAIPGLTIWETRKLYRVDGTEIEGEGWSSPFIFGSVPLDPVIYYLKPTAGTTLLNGNGTLNVVATKQDQSNGESSIDIAEGIRISTSSDGSTLLDTNNEDFTTDDIDGTLTLYLVNTINSNVILDTLTLVDVTDGLPVGTVEGNPGLVFTQTGPSTWDPGTITVTATFYDANGGVEASTTGVLAVNQSNGEIDIQTNFNETEITVDDTGTESTQVGLVFTLVSDPSRSVQETIYSVTQGETGETGLTGATGPSVTYTGGWQVDRGMYYAGTHSGTDPDTGNTGNAIGEVVRFDHTSPLSPKEWHEDNGSYYICTTSHDPLNIVPAAANGTVDTNYWQEFGAQFESVATGLLLAETVIAQDMFGETLELTDSFKLASPSGTCTNIAMNLDDADGSGQLGGADDASADHNTWNGHWQMGTHRGLLHNDWNSANETTFNLTEATVIAVNAYDVTGTSYKEELLALQPGSIIELYTDAGIDQSTGDLAEDFYDIPFYFKIVEDPIKVGASQPTAVYMAQTLADAGPSQEYGSTVVSPNVMQLDVIHMPTLDDGTVGNSLSTDFPYDSGVGIKLRIHSGFSTEGECIANGGTWTPHNQRIELTSAGLQAYNGGGDRTVNIKSADGDFEFGNFDAGQGIKYTGSSLQMNGTLMIDGTPVNEQMRSVSLGTEVQSFVFQKSYLNFTGLVESAAPWPSPGGVYAQGAASWSFTTDNDSPLLIRVMMNDPDGKPVITLNGSELGGPYAADWDDHTDGTEDENTQRWYEWFDDGTHAISGQNTIQLVCASHITDCTDGFDVTKVQVFGDVNTEAITINSTVINGGTDPEPVWTATQTGNVSIAAASTNINLATTSNTSATITINEFMNHTANSALRSTAATIQAYYAGGSQSPTWGTDISDTITINRILPGLPGEQSITGYLTNESGTIAMGNTGDFNYNGTVTPEITGVFQVYDGINQVPYDDITYTATGDANTTCAMLAEGAYVITEVTGVDTGTCSIEAAYGGITLQKLFTLSLAREGETIQGDPAKSVRLESDSLFWTKGEDGAYNLVSITVTLNHQHLEGNDDGTWSVVGIDSYQESVDYSGNTQLYFHRDDFLGGQIEVTFTTSVVDGSISDSLTISELIEGSSSLTTVMTNEAHVFPADVNGQVTSYSGSGTDISLYQGANRLDYDGVGTSPGTWKLSETPNLADITEGSVSSSGTTPNRMAVIGDHSNITDSVDSFTLTYGISGQLFNGESFSGITKTQSLSKSKTGEAGQSGAPATSHTFEYDELRYSDSNFLITEGGYYSISYQTDLSASNDYANFDQSFWNHNIQSGFQNANIIVLSTYDSSGTSREYIYEKVAVGSELVYFINNNRWYSYIVQKVIVSDSQHQVLIVSYKAHIVDTDSDVPWSTGGSGNPAGPFPVSLGFSAVQGIDGQAGTRGSSTYYVDICDETTNNAWDDTIAVDTAGTNGGVIARDVVTLFCDTAVLQNGQIGFSETRYYDGASGTNTGTWIPVAQVIDGNLIVHGTIGADQIQAGSITADEIAAGAITADKIAVGIGGNLLYPNFKDVTGIASLEAAGWQFTGQDSIGGGDVSKEDPKTEVNGERAAISFFEDGSGVITITTPEVPIDPAIGYNLTAAFYPHSTNANGSADISLRVRFYDISGNQLNHTIAYKNGASSGSNLSFENDAWHFDNASAQSTLWDSAEVKWHTQTSSDSADYGFINYGHRLNAYVYSINSFAHPAITENNVIKSGGALPAMYKQLRGIEELGARVTGTMQVGNVRIPAPAATCQLEIRYDVQNQSGDNGIGMFDLGISPGGTTLIDGNSITTGTLNADHINASFITVDNLTSSLVSAGVIKSFDERTFWNLSDGVMVVKDDTGTVRVKLGDLTASDDIP